MKWPNLFVCAWIVLILAVFVPSASAQCGGGGCSQGLSSCSGGGCGSQVSSVNQNDAVIQQQQQQIQQLQQQIDSLSTVLQQKNQIAQLQSNLNQVVQTRNLRGTEQRLLTGNPNRQGSLVQIGTPDNDQPVFQRVQQVTAPPQPRVVQAPVVRVQQTIPRPRPTVSSRWQR